MDLLRFVRVEVGFVVLENVGLIGSDNVNVARFEPLHIISCDQDARTFHHPFDLHFAVAVQMRVVMRQLFLLDNNCTFAGNGYGELYDFHNIKYTQGG